MPTTSQDILNITLAATVIILTIFLCFVFSYLIRVLRDIYRLTDSVRRRVDAVWQYFERMKDKTESIGATTAVISQAVIRVIDYVKKRKANNQKSKRESKKEED